MTSMTSQRPLIASAMTLGVGMGAFLDGIVFHQILQSHNMLSAKYPPTDVVNLEVNMFWDGLFHMFCWVVTAVGIGMVWHVARTAAAPLKTRTLIGSLLIGFGMFNLVEGVINHHILHLHHVTETENHLVWDLTFLASGVVLMVVGMLIIRAGNRTPLPYPSAGRQQPAT